jgi:hypothetical protein
LFPELQEIAISKPISASEECGEYPEEEFCSSITGVCQPEHCNSTCPYGTAAPEALDVLSFYNSSAVSRDSTGQFSVRLNDSTLSTTAQSSLFPTITASGFSLAMWINQDENTDGLVNRFNY